MPDIGKISGRVVHHFPEQETDMVRTTIVKGQKVNLRVSSAGSHSLRRVPFTSSLNV